MKKFINPEVSVLEDIILTDAVLSTSSVPHPDLEGDAPARMGAAGPATHVTTINPERMSN